MMKWMASVAVVFLAGPLALAQSKVGVVDVNKVIRESTQGKMLFQSISNFVESKKAEIAVMGESLKAKQALAEAEGLTDSERADARREARRLQTEIKRASEDADQTRKHRLQDGGRELEKGLSRVIRQVSAEMGLDLVLNSGPDSGILYFSDAVDLTAAVLARFNQTEK